MRGNHRDGWVEGAWDPLAGAIAELGEARAIGALLKTRLAAATHAGVCQLGWRGAGADRAPPNGWRPTRRNCSNKAVLYLNSDENGRGFIMPGGSDSLQQPAESGGGSGDRPGNRGERAGAAARPHPRRWRWVAALEGGRDVPRRTPRPRAATCCCSHSAPDPTSYPSCITWASAPCRWSTAGRRTSRASTIRAMTPSITTCVSVIRTSSTACRWRRPMGG